MTDSNEPLSCAEFLASKSDEEIRDAAEQMTWEVGVIIDRTAQIEREPGDEMVAVPAVVIVTSRWFPDA